MCKVCDREPIWKKFRFWDYHTYCSLYCQLFDKLGLKKYKPSKNKHTKHLEHWPPIEQNCEKCGETFELRWRGDHSVRAFCCQPCNNYHIRKRAARHYFPLKVLKHYDGELTALDINERLGENLVYRFNSTKVAQILRAYIAKGYVIRTPGPAASGGWPNTYRMTDWAKTQPVKSLIV